MSRDFNRLAVFGWNRSRPAGLVADASRHIFGAEKRAGARGAPARGVLGFEGKALRDLGRAVSHCAVMLSCQNHKSITML